MNPQTLLMRQINPNFLQNGRPTSQVFRPTPKDESLLSVYDGDLIDAQGAYDHYTTQLQLRSSGVMAVSVEQCSNIDLPSRLDPVPFPEHAVIDFTGLSNKIRETKSKLLRANAQDRGWLLFFS